MNDAYPRIRLSGSPSSPIWLSPWQRWALLFFAAALLLFGGLVELRSAFLKRPMTDVQVFFRAAWAVRTGSDLYAITDDNGWHYHYPPLFAILLTPLADAPAGVERAGLLPYPVSVALWYLFNLGCLALGVHWLAAALERTFTHPALREQPVGGRGWCMLRMIPVLVCLPPIGHTLMRGQANLLVLALLCGALALLLRGRDWTAGLCLAGAICVKIIPAFLLIYPLWRRDGRCLAGAALGLILGLVVIPAAVFGPGQAVAHYERLAEVLIWPALGKGQDQSRARELIEMTATHSQSLRSLFHNALYWDRATRPPHPASAVHLAHWAVGGLLTLLTLLAAGWHRRANGPPAHGPGMVIAFGALMLLMLLVSPVCHHHYFCLALPLVMGLVAWTWERQGRMTLGTGLTCLLVCYTTANTLPHLPGLEVLRSGLAGLAALVLWAIAVLRLSRPIAPGQRLVVERLPRAAA